MRLAVSVAVFFSVPFLAYASSIHITEVAFNPTGSDTGAEYIVVKNVSGETQDVTGWQLYPDGIGYFTFPAFSLAAGASAKVLLRQSGSNSDSTLYYPTPTTNMGNTSGSVALFSGTQHDASTLIDFMQYGRSGETWETSADEAGLWLKSELVATSAEEEGLVLQRTTTGHSASAWGRGGAREDAANTDNAEESSDAGNEAASIGGGKVSSAPTFKPKIRAFAGSDRTSVAGAEITFSGKALDAEDQPLESQLVRYLWNFGDGTFAEGKNVTHVYGYPGTYTATLIITQDHDAAQDDCVVKVGNNTVQISEAMFGPKGWVELTNTAAAPVDVSKWYMSDAAGVQFILPAGTRIAGKGFVVLENTTTKLLQLTGSMFPLRLHYQNGRDADVFTYVGSMPPDSSVSRNGAAVVLGRPTPGFPAKGETSEPVLAQSKPAVRAQPPAETTSRAAEAQVAMEQEKERRSLPIAEAPAFNAPVTKNVSTGKEMQWLLGSIVAGLLVGGIVASVARARTRLT